jgi:hypothetical protein
MSPFHAFEGKASSYEHRSSYLMQGSCDFNIDESRIGSLFNRDNPIRAIWIQKPSRNFTEKALRIIENLFAIKP